MLTIPTWRPHLAEATTAGWQVHIYVPGGSSLCLLSDITSAEKVEPDVEVTACGPCLVAAGVLTNLARQVLHGAGDPTQTAHDAAESLIAGPFGEITRPDAIREWVRGENYTDLPDRPADEWTTITEGGR